MIAFPFGEAFFLISHHVMREKHFLERLYLSNKQMSRNYPTKLVAQDFLNHITNLLFPVCKEVNINSGKQHLEWEHLKLQLKELLLPMKSFLKRPIEQIVEEYFEHIPDIYEDLLLDAETINSYDPAAHSIEEIILAYPGFQAIMTYRLAHPLYLQEIPVLPRLFSEFAHTNTGIDINPGARIGKSFFIDHGTGIVIGETTRIGNNVKIYQGVTLGALSVRKEEAKTKRHPTIEDHVIIYSGTTILGGNTSIGHHSVVGGNVWLTQSIEPYSVVYNKSEIKVRNGQEKISDPINFII